MSRAADEKRPALSVQRIQDNQAICLKAHVLKMIGAEPGDFVCIMPGDEPGTIIIELDRKGTKEEQKSQSKRSIAKVRQDG